MRRYTEDELDELYTKTCGYCEYCGKKLSRINYGSYDRKGGWHVDHSVSRLNGGTDYFRNRFPACIDCNIEKGGRNGKSYRASMQRRGIRDSGPDWEKVVGWGVLGLLALGVVKQAQAPAPPSPGLLAKPSRLRWPPRW